MGEEGVRLNNQGKKGYVLMDPDRDWCKKKGFEAVEACNGSPCVLGECS